MMLVSNARTRLLISSGFDCEVMRTGRTDWVIASRSCSVGPSPMPVRSQTRRAVGKSWRISLIQSIWFDHSLPKSRSMWWTWMLERFPLMTTAAVKSPYLAQSMPITIGLSSGRGFASRARSMDSWLKTLPEGWRNFASYSIA